jgi:hypothetical protein
MSDPTDWQTLFPVGDSFIELYAAAARRCAVLDGAIALCGVEFAVL